jgi:hypothetical protein
MDWMWAFMQSTLIPWLIVGIVVRFLNHALFSPPFSPFHVRRIKCYNTCHCMDRHRLRANIHQGNDGMCRVHPRHEPNTKPSLYFRLLRREYSLQRELRQAHRSPPKPSRPRPSSRKDGYCSESHENKAEPHELKLKLPEFAKFYDSLKFEYGTEWESACEKPVDRGTETLHLDLPLFDEFFYSLKFKSHETLDWESASIEPYNDRPQSLDIPCLDAFAQSINPFKALKKIKQVAMLVKHVMRKKQSQRNTCRQALLSAALITGNAVTMTVSVYCSHQDDCIPTDIDTGASASVTPVLADFIKPLCTCAVANLKGLSGTTEVIGEVTASWLVRDMFGNERKIRTTAYYVPAALIQRFSPQTYFKEKKAGSLLITHDRMVLTLKYGSRLDFPYQENNLPLVITDEHFTKIALTVALTFEDETVMATLDVTDVMNQNTTAPQRDLMMWHQKWAHCDIARVQTLLATPRDTSQNQLIEPRHAKAPSSRSRIVRPSA